MFGCTHSTPEHALDEVQAFDRVDALFQAFLYFPVYAPTTFRIIPKELDRIAARLF